MRALFAQTAPRVGHCWIVSLWRSEHSDAQQLLRCSEPGWCATVAIVRSRGGHAVNPTEPNPHLNRPSLQRAWDAIPAAVRAILAGFVILMIGG